MMDMNAQQIAEVIKLAQDLRDRIADRYTQKRCLEMCCMAYFDKANSSIVPSWLGMNGKKGSRAAAEFTNVVKDRLIDLYEGMVAKGAIVECAPAPEGVLLEENEVAVRFF